MDLFKEITALVNVIVWPVVVLILGFTFKGTLRDIGSRIRGAKYKDLEIEFQQKLVESEELITKSKVEHKVGKSESFAMSTEFLNQIKAISDVSPRALVVESWIQLETVIDRLTKETTSGVVRPNIALDELVKSGIIENSDIEVYKNIRNMRNNVLHNYNFKIGQDQAIEYALLVYRLMENINRKKKNA